MGKPREILELEEEYGIELEEVKGEEFNNNTDCYVLDEEGNVICLNIFDNGISEISLDHFTCLAKLNLSFNPISKIENLDSLTQLESLDLSNTPITKIENLDSLTQLESLDLSNTPITKIENLDLLTQLESLYLSNTQISKIENLDSLIHLESLYLSNTQISKIENLDSLIHLESLDLSHTQISKIENLESLTQLKSLSLSYTQISKIENLESLTQLKSLSLSYTQISKIENLDSLTQLESLSLSNTQISKIENLDSLIHLESLDLSGTQISKIENLDSLIHLESLYLSNTQISKIENLDSLTQLKSLYLSYTQISKIENLNSLTQLESLYLSYTQISKIENLDSLIHLESLYLSNTQISKIENLDSLIHLESLYLSNTQISKIENLESLTQLKSLSLSYTQISKIENLESLTQLKSLSLSYTQISKIENLESLTQLKSLSLSEASIFNIKDIELVEKIKSLDYLGIDGNKFLANTPIILLKHRNHLPDILNYLSAQKDPTLSEYTLPVKIMIVGNHQSGKSTFVNYLIKGELPENSHSTHILSIKRYPEDEEKLPEAMIYDFGGQDYYHGLYQAFFSLDAINLLFWCKESDRNEIRESGGIKTRDYTKEYWLNQLKYAFDKRRKTNTVSTEPVLMIQTHADLEQNNRSSYKGNPEEFSILNEFYISLKKEVCEDAKRPVFRLGLEYLKETIRQEVLNKKKIERRPAYYKEFMEWLISQKAKTFISINKVGGKYKRKLDGINDKRKYLEADLHQLALRGMILYYPDNAAIKDVIWPNPTKTIEYIHKKVLSKEGIKDSKGMIGETEFNRLCKDTKIKELLLSEKVIFHDKHYRRYIIPSYLPLYEDAGSEYYDMMVFEFTDPNFTIKFNHFIPFGLINQLICLYGDNPDKKNFWRDQLIFTFKGRFKIWIKLDFTNLEIAVYIRQKEDKGNHEFSLDKVERMIFMNIIDLYWGEDVIIDFERKKKDAELTDLLFERKKESVEEYFARERRFPKDMFLSVDNQNFICYQELEDLSDSREQLMTYTINPETHTLDLRKGRTCKPYTFKNFTTNEKVTTMKKIFISYSRKDVDYKNELKKHLNMLKTFNIADNWSCEDITVEEWDKRIKQELDESDIIIYMLSANFFSSSYILENEVERIMNDAEKKRRIVCVIVSDFIGIDKLRSKLEDRDLTTLQSACLRLGEYQYLPYGNIENKVTKNTEEQIIPLKRHPDIEEAFTQIVQKVMKVV